MKFTQKRRQMVASIICIILILSMVLPLLITTVF